LPPGCRQEAGQERTKTFRTELPVRFREIIRVLNS
jgi:hypothetical protein